MRNTRMLRDYHEGRLQLMRRDTYVSLICDQLEMISGRSHVEFEKMGSLE